MKHVVLFSLLLALGGATACAPREAILPCTPGLPADPDPTAGDPSDGDGENPIPAPEPPLEGRGEKDWEIILAPYALLANITGEAAMGQAGAADVDVDFTEILEALELGAMAHAEVRLGRWGLLTDFAYMKLKDDITTPRKRVFDAQVEELELEALLFYRFPLQRGWVDVYGGMRYWNISLDVDFTGPILPLSSDRQEEWVDPVIGGRFSYPFDFSWNVVGLVGWDVTDWFTLAAGYRALGVDYDNDRSGRNFFSYDTITHGPLLGFVFKL